MKNKDKSLIYFLNLKNLNKFKYKQNKDLWKVPLS